MLDVQGRNQESSTGGGCGWAQAGCHGGCVEQSGGMAKERGWGVAGRLAETEFGEIVRLEECELRGWKNNN